MEEKLKRVHCVDDMFREIWIPLAVRYGIPETEFWRMNPKTLERRLPYFEEIQKRKQQEMYTNAWLAGRYVQMAVSANLSKCFKYPDEPPDLYAEEETVEEATIKAALKFREFANAHNKRMEVKDDG